MSLHLGRYLDLASLVIKHGRRDLLDHDELDAVADDPDGAGSGDPEAFVQALEELGPTFVKLGQLLSTRTDLLPPAHLDALERLQDNVEPLPFEVIQEVVEEQLGVRISTAFGSFDPDPLASASLAQVHRATMRDGREVAVKVQRPDIRSRVQADVEVLERLARMVDRAGAGRRARVEDLVEEFRRSLLRELDYRREAQHLRTLHRNLADFDRIVVPLPIDDFTTSRVLTMDLVPGRKVTKLSPLRKIDLDGEALAEQLLRAYLQQILDDGFVHADPHPGNVLITPDDEIALIDLGMVVRIDAALRDALLHLVVAIADGDTQGAVTAALSVCRIPADVEPDRAAFERAVKTAVTDYLDLPPEDLRIGQLVLRLSRDAASAGYGVPPELSLVGRSLLNLDAVGRALAPGLDPDATIRRIAAEVATGDLIDMASPGKLVRSVLQTKEMVEELPGRVNRILGNLADGEFHITVDAFDEVRLTSAIQKVANRVTLGLVLAALIVGAAMMMRVPTSTTLFGYPALAIVAFLLAAVGAVGLIIQILRSDDHR